MRRAAAPPAPAARPPPRWRCASLPVNDAPRLVQPPSDQVVPVGQRLEFELAGGSFVDPDVGDRLGYAATLADGSALPTWLGFDSASLTFKGDPAAADIGVMTVRVTVTDAAGATAQALFVVDVSEAAVEPVTPVASPPLPPGPAVDIAPAAFSELSISDALQLLRNDELLRRFDDLKHQMKDLGQDQRNLMASSLAITSGLSIGYVVWLVRGGVLVSSMLSALPAWQMIDPMPVLAAAGAVKKRLRGRWRRGEADEPMSSSCSTPAQPTPPAPVPPHRATGRRHRGRTR